MNDNDALAQMIFLIVLGITLFLNIVITGAFVEPTYNHVKDIQKILSTTTSTATTTTTLPYLTCNTGDGIFHTSAEVAIRAHIEKFCH